MLDRYFRKSPVTRIAAPRGAVPRRTQTLLEQRGWSRNWLGVWEGSYATAYGTWRGRIETLGLELRVFIKNPPRQLHSHEKWPCFHEHDGPWYRVHLHTQPVDRDPSAVIHYIERIIVEAFKR